MIYVVGLLTLAFLEIMLGGASRSSSNARYMLASFLLRPIFCSSSDNLVCIGIVSNDGLAFYDICINLSIYVR